MFLFGEQTMIQGWLKYFFPNVDAFGQNIFHFLAIFPVDSSLNVLGWDFFSLSYQRGRSVTHHGTLRPLCSWLIQPVRELWGCGLFKVGTGATVSIILSNNHRNSCSLPFPPLCWLCHLSAGKSMMNVFLFSYPSVVFYSPHSPGDPICQLWVVAFQCCSEASPGHKKNALSCLQFPDSQNF